MRLNLHFGVLAPLILLIGFSNNKLAYAQQKIMPTGNSITVGDGSSGVGGYRDDLQTMLGNESVSFLFVGSQDDGSTTHQPNHEGHGSKQTIFIDNNINTWLTTETPNFVILHIGTNDISGNIAPETARDNIDSILGKIRTFDPNIKIILCSIVPRTDAKDGNTDALNILIEALYFTKLTGGGNVFYAGVNETFKSNPNWAADYMSDSIHPNDTGYNIMAGVIFNAIMNCINGTDLTVLDNFNRISGLGVTWAADPEYAIVNNELSNTHSVVEWGFLAVFKAMRNPKSIAVKFGQNADAAGINQGALAVMLDSASPDANGYMVWVQSDGKIQLWTIVNGAPGAAIDDQDGSLSPPQSGDELKVLISSDATSHHFDVFINGELHGRVSDSQKLQGNNPILYAGVKLKGGLNNDIDDFKLQKTNDVVPPAQITDLRVDSSDATSIALAWTATGDDGDEGQASAVDLRISTATITANNFENATKVLGVGTPNVAGTPETFTVNGLLPSMTYFFAIKAVDDAGLVSQISNIALGGTSIGLSAVDDFNRASLGGNWNVASSYSIVSNELSNTSGIDDWTGIAVYNTFTNPVTASLRYGVNVSANGIKVTALVLMLNESNEATADGYMVWHNNGNILMWEVQNGFPLAEITSTTALLSDPSPGDILSINLSSDANGHHFDVFINGAFDGQLSDPAKLQGNGTGLYAGVMLKGGQSNNIDDFSLTSAIGDPASITITGGQNQVGLVNQQLPEPLTVQVLDENNNPAVGTAVIFSVLFGGGSIQATTDPNRVVLEAESGNLISPMQSSSDGSASNGQFIYVPDGAGQNGLAIFNFEISVAGNYVIWGRGIAESDTDDSFFISIDDGVEQLWDMFQGVTATDWTWDQVSDRGSGSAASPQTNPVEFNLSVGTHKLEVRQREDGSKLDEIFITRDFNFIPSGIVAVNAAVVDENGDAMAIWTLGPTIGANSVQASVSGLTPVVFNATATPDTAQSITKDSGDNQTGTASQPLSNPFGVLVVGKIGSPLAGVDVTFSVIEGDGNFGGLSQITVASDSQGIAGATLTLGSVTGATNRAEASVLISGNHITGSPMTFTATSALPQKLEAVSQLTQSGTANSALADSIEVRVRDTLDNPLPGFPVELSVTLGGGRVNGSESPVTVLTNAAGVAKVQWRLGSTAGSNNNKIQASAKFLGNEIIGSPVEFTASAQAGSAANLAMVSGNDQTGLIQSDLAQPFVIKVTDGANNPIAGWPVKFKVLAGGGKFSGADSVEVITNSSGEASATLTFGSEAGTPQNPFNNIVETSAENNNQALSGSPLTFRASAVSTGATHFEEISGNDLTARAGEPLPQPVTVKVTDGPPASNPIAGHSVRFRITGGGGTINDLTTTDTTITTDANGFASVSWYMGGDLASNAQKLEVSATDGINNLTGSPMSFQATATAGAVDPDASFLTASPSTVLADGQSRTTLTVTLTDKFGNRIPGSPVTLNSTGSNNIFQQPQNPTDSNGQVTSTLASTSAEIKSVSARIIGGISLNSFTNVTFIALAPEKVTISRGDSQSGNIGTALDQPMEVLVTDKNNNNVPGIDVTFQVAGGGGYLMDESSTSQGQSVTVQTDSLGKARAIWILGPNAGTNTAEAAVSFNGSELTGSPRNFNGTGVTASATSMAIFNGDNQQGGIAGITLPKPLQVKIMDAAGKPVFDVPVNFTIQLGGGTLANANPRTDYRGIAESLFALDPIVGTNIVNASSGNLAGSPTVFTFLSVVGTPAILTAKIGDGGSAVVNSLYPIAVEITDINGNPIEGAHTNFAVVEGSGSIEGPQNPLTDAAGLAQTQVRLPTTMGDLVVKATSNDLPGFFVTFDITALPAAAANIAEFSGNNQDGTIGRELPLPFKVRVTDPFGNPVSGHEVQWVRTIGSGSPSSSAVMTDEDGFSSFNYTLGNAVGANQVKAITTFDPVVFDATGVTNNFPLFSGLTDQTVVEGNTLQFQVTANDADSDPIIYEAQNLPSGASFDVNSRTFSWTPDIGVPGAYQVTFIARDNKGGFDSETITVTVLNSNNPPVINSFTPPQLDVQFNFGQIINFAVNVSDADGDDIEYLWLLFTDLNSNGTKFSTSFDFEFITSQFSPGTYIVRVEVTDKRDTVVMEWRIDIVTSVELASFEAQFGGFDGVQVSWTTSREIDNLGFDILRSRSEDGTYTKITDELLPADSDGQYQFIDKNIQVGVRYYYKLEDVNLNGVRTEHGPISVEITAPETFELSQNYPNPFNPETKIRYQLPNSGEVVVKIFDILGREVKSLVNEKLEAGFHEVTWNGRNNSGRKVSSGVYYYQIRAGEFKETKKMILMK